MTASNLHITDKTGIKVFRTVCSTAYIEPEIRNLQRTLKEAKQNPEAYKFLDLETAHLVVNGKVFREYSELTDDEILKELFAEGGAA